MIKSLTGDNKKKDAQVQVTPPHSKKMNDHQSIATTYRDADE
jgi:hypothetical protein